MAWNSKALDKFCGSPFWNSSLTWYTDDPELTRCFEKTALVLIPISFLFLISPFEIFYLKHSPNRNIPWNWKNSLKIITTTALALICLSDFLSNIGMVKIYKVDIFMPMLKFVSYVYAGVLIYYNKFYGYQASGHQFIFWFLSALCGAPQFRTEIRNVQQNGELENYYFYKSYMIYYPLVVLMFLLNCLADNKPKQYPYGKVQNKCPFDNTSFLGRILWTFVDGILYHGFKRPLEQKDMWNLALENESQNLTPKFEQEFQKRVAKNKEKFMKKQKEGNVKGKPDTVSIIPVIWSCFYRTFLVGASFRMIQDLMAFVNPQILSLVISFVQSDEPQWKGIFYALLMFFVSFTQTLIHHMGFNFLWTFGQRTRVSLMMAIYRKALRISNATRKDKTVGEIVNLMAVDAEKFLEISLQLPMMWAAPTQICFAVYFLWQEVGPAVLAGLALMILLIPVNTVIVRISRKLQLKQMKNKDERVKMMNEILNGIKVLKLYAWEGSFEKIVEMIRIKEVKTLLNMAYLNASSNFIWNCAPFMVSFTVFGTYVLLDPNNLLDPSKTFVSLALLNILRQPMHQIPNVINMAVQAAVSIKRINSFLNSEELNPYVEHKPSEDFPIIIENGTFSWGEQALLKNINMRISKKSLTAIVGPVGSGKSSLISALLGEMEKVAGNVNTDGSIAYVSQQAWIQNATVRENIIFGKEYDHIRYNKVLDACALRPDLDMLANGDLTEIGERGINLSGGQKQRVSLARAVYCDADIYLFDDPLSAVDSHVGKHLFSHVIGSTGLLRHKVRILVTHAVTYLPKTDNIYVIKDGEITESGSYQELLVKKGSFADFLIQHINDDADESELDEIEAQLAHTPIGTEVKRKISRQRSRLSESSLSLDRSNSPSIESLKKTNSISLRKSKRNVKSSKISLQDEQFKKDKGKLVTIEKAEKGRVKISVFKYYLSAVGSFIIFVSLLFFFGYQGSGICSNMWLGWWAEDENIIVNGTVNTKLRDMYLGVYAVMGILQGICILLANIIYARGTNSAAAKLHNILMGSVMRLPMQFFDVTPIGRILARFSSDIVGVDQRLPGAFNNLFFNGTKVLGTIFVICYTTPIFIAVIIPIAALYIFIQRYFVSTTRQLRRIESVSRSPIYSHFGETISGTHILRAYNCQERFIHESERRLDQNQMCLYPSAYANRWLAIRLEAIGAFIILFSALFAILNRNLHPAMVGLSISYALQITSTLNILVRQSSEVETAIVSVERIKEYSEVKQEKPWEIPEKKPSLGWPDSGKVEFCNYSVKYRPGLSLVLNDISFNIIGGEKVGIVGRTGAGKSSLTLSLFRIIEATEGKIFIDDINISEIGLHDLRSKLTIIPQDAILFSGSLRMNLDPFDIYSDEDIWKAVEHAHLKDYIKSLPAGLYHKVSEGGENLSVGQRQLICLARALLRKTKILILDEATAAVDLETDDLIQKTIRTEFSDCTVLTIAHRLNTIIDSNRVLVLDKGKIAEFDSPSKLLENKESIFYGLCKDAGLVS